MAMIWRILIFVAIGLAIFWGVRRVWRDWQGMFRSDDKRRRMRDLSERRRSDVIDLRRDGDGVYRPPTGEGRGRDGQD